MAIANYSSNTKIPTNMPWHYNDVKYASREHAFTAGKWLPVYFTDLFPFFVAFFFNFGQAVIYWWRRNVSFHEDVIKWTHLFPAQRPVTRCFDVFLGLRLNKLLSKQWWGWRFETLSRLLWRQCNDPPNVTGYFCPNWSGCEFLKRVIPMMKSGSHVCQRSVNVSWSRHLNTSTSRVFVQPFVHKTQTKQKQTPRVTGTLWGEPPVSDRFPSHRVNNTNAFPCHNVIEPEPDRLVY